MNRFRSWTFTVRPGLGLTKKTEEQIVKWMCKQEGYFACIEMEDEKRHLHGQIWLAEAREKGKINTALQRICERTIDDFNNAQLRVLTAGTRFAYSDWYNSYLEDNDKKEGQTVNEICREIPDKTMGYYPSEADQQKALNTFNAVSKRFHRWETKFLEKKIPKDWGSIGRFVLSQMFLDRTEEPIQDTKCRRQFTKTLYMYINKMTVEVSLAELDAIDGYKASTNDA